MRDHSADQTTDGGESEGVNLHSKNPKKSSIQTGSLEALVKPSGLRMPSPKIGFFDGVKSSARTPKDISKGNVKIASVEGRGDGVLVDKNYHLENDENAICMNCIQIMYFSVFLLLRDYQLNLPVSVKK